MCKLKLERKNGKDKGKELFTEGRTYMIEQNGNLVRFYGLGDIAVHNNEEQESTFTKEVFDKHFEFLF